MTECFANRLMDRVRDLGPLCVGIDPHPGRLPALFGPEGPDAVRDWALELVALAARHAAIIKPQVALFEAHGPEGMIALQALCHAARDTNTLLIMDAKRGDIGSSAEGYARAYLAGHAPFPSDALTVNPYMGLDTLEPYVREAETHGRGVAVLARTSNPGASDFQLLKSDNTPLYLNIASALAPLRKRLRTANSDWSGLMLVAGATAPEEARAIREAAPDALLLVPGYGSQGGSAKDALAGFVSTPRGLEGGVVNASRSVTLPETARSAETLADWRAAIETAMTAAQNDLRTACQTA